MRTILVVLYVFLFLLLGLPVLGIEWIISKFNKQAADISQLRIVQWGFRCVSFLSGIKLTVKGEENVPTDQPVLYIGNHRSFFDIVVTYARCPGLTGYISKDGVNKVPILGLWMRRLYCLFLDRKDLKQGLKVILTAIDQVKSGISICIFPEGTPFFHSKKVPLKLHRKPNVRLFQWYLPVLRIYLRIIFHGSNPQKLH